MNKLKNSRLSRFASLAVAILFGLIAISASANAQDRDYDRYRHDHGSYYNSCREHQDRDYYRNNRSRTYVYITPSPYYNVRYRRHFRHHHHHMDWDDYNRR